MLSSFYIGKCWRVNSRDGLGLGRKQITVRDTSFAVRTSLKGQAWHVSTPMNFLSSFAKSSWYITPKKKINGS